MCCLFPDANFLPTSLGNLEAPLRLYRSTEFGEGLGAQRAIGFIEFSRCSRESGRL